MTSAVGYWPVPPEVRKEFEQWLDGYIEQYRKAIDRLLRSRTKTRDRTEKEAVGSSRREPRELVPAW
jgi:hypothetical protein